MAVCRLVDIARELNVTANTVSKALKNSDKISEATREKIKAKAAEMGYVPNLSARYMRTGRTKIIAIVYDYLLNPYYSIVSDVIEDTLAKSQYSLILFTEKSPGAKLTLNTFNRILSRGADGIVSFLDFSDEVVSQLEASRCRSVVVGRKSEHECVDSIASDDMAGAYKATKYLIDNGHRDILMFTMKDGLSCSAARIAGYQKALEEAGIEVNPENILRGLHASEAFEEADKKRLVYSAIFCFNDLLAFETIDLLRSRNVRVPQDVSIVGYDYIESHFKTPVGLTTVDTDKVHIAELATRTLLSKLEGHPKKISAVLPEPRLIAGRTVASRQ